MKDLPPKIEESQSKDGLTAKETYNVVSDTVVGVNVRAKDNLIQGVIILFTVIIGLVIGQMYGGFLFVRRTGRAHRWLAREGYFLDDLPRN